MKLSCLNKMLHLIKTIIIQRYQFGDDSAIGNFDRSSEFRTRRWYRASLKFKLLGHEALCRVAWSRNCRCASAGVRSRVDNDSGFCVIKNFDVATSLKVALFLNF